MGSSTSNASVSSAVVLALVLAFATPARAEDDATEACLSAHTEGQRAQKAGRLLEARARFLSCSAASCPDLAKQQCVPHVFGQLPSSAVGTANALHASKDKAVAN